MIFRFVLGAIFLAVFAGCATTGARTQQEQLQSRVTALEKKVEEKDSEIVDLQYQVKDLASKVADKTPVPSTEESVAVREAASAQNSVQGSSVNDAIRVNVPVTDVQTALTNAGVYSGKIDGKVGAATKAAIIAFQKAHHLTADGILGRKTWKRLKAYLTQQAQQDQPQPASPSEEPVSKGKQAKVKELKE